MFEHKLNPGKNAILCVLKGKFDADEARRYNERFKAGVDQLKPGMIVITDLTEYVPAEEEVRAILQEGTEYALKKGIEHSVRIVTDSVASKVSNIQFNTTARRLGYQADVVNSMDEAKRLLGW